MQWKKTFIFLLHLVIIFIYLVFFTMPFYFLFFFLYHFVFHFSFYFLYINGFHTQKWINEWIHQYWIYIHSFHLQFSWSIRSLLENNFVFKFFSMKLFYIFQNVTTWICYIVECILIHNNYYNKINIVILISINIDTLFVSIYIYVLHLSVKKNFNRNFRITTH